MIQTVVGVIFEDGRVRLLQADPVNGTQRALFTILNEQPVIHPDETARLGEAALTDWKRPEKDAAWAYLQLES